MAPVRARGLGRRRLNTHHALLLPDAMSKLENGKRPTQATCCTATNEMNNLLLATNRNECRTIDFFPGTANLSHCKEFALNSVLRRYIWRGRLKMGDWNYRHRQKCRGGKCRTGNIGTMLQPTGGGKCGTGIIGTKLQGWKMRDQAVMESQNTLLRLTASHNMIYLIICQNLQCSVCFYISGVYVCLFFISVLLYYTL